MSHQLFRTLVTALFLVCLCTSSVLAADTATYTDHLTGMEFVQVPGGTFTMGNNDDKWASPEHQVKLSGFYIGKYEVTFGQYDLFCEATGKNRPDDEGWGRGDRPVINVSWQDAVEFTRWLSDKTGQSYRLPSEAEWEYAARAGQETRFWWGDDVGQNKANCRSCGSRWDKKLTAPVSAFEPNPWGLYNVHGNVYEWVFDTWHENYHGAPADGSPWLHGNTQKRVSRGGSWWEIPNSLYASARNWTSAKERRNTIGFRLALTP